MRMLLPGVKQRRVVDQKLTAFYERYQAYDWDEALAILCVFYHVKTPVVEFHRQIDRGKTLGKCYEDGHLQLIHPKDWKGTAREWVRTFYHEFAHYLFWTDAEAKADRFVRHFVAKLRPTSDS